MTGYRSKLHVAVLLASTAFASQIAPEETSRIVKQKEKFPKPGTLHRRKP